MTDDMLKAVAKNGGVVQVNYYSAFISQAYRDASIAQQPEVAMATEELKAKFKAEGKQVTYGDLEKLQRQYADRIPRPPLSALIDNIDHIAKIAGVDHVGLGSDFDGVSGSFPRASTRRLICRRLPRRCWRAATPRRTAGRFSAATCCGSSARWSE